MHARAHSHGLYPAQWSALRYFKSAAREHQSAIALARYQGLAFGAVARTVRTLIDRGYLRRAGRIGKGRAEAIELTPQGESMLAADPLAGITEAICNWTTKPGTRWRSFSTACCVRSSRTVEVACGLPTRRLRSDRGIETRAVSR